jgi:hypothetical protein
MKGVNKSNLSDGTFAARRYVSRPRSRKAWSCSRCLHGIAPRTYYEHSLSHDKSVEFRLCDDCVHALATAKSKEASA